MRPIVVQLGWAAAGLASLAIGGLLQPAIERTCRENNLMEPASVAALRRLDMPLLNIAPGGLRAPLVNYLWIRAEALKNSGRFFDAMQLADLICKLQPHFAAVWSFHSWNMAWNISVATHTPEERWTWVSNGMKLLRDEGIPLNPRAQMLYKDLGWLFFFKIAGDMDEMHVAYKQRWASQMQRLLGAPPHGDAQQVIDAFAVIASAPLDKDPSRPRAGGNQIQPDKLQQVLAEPRAAAYAALLASHGVGVDRTLLDAYNRFSRDVEIAGTRLIQVQPANEADEALSQLINDPAHAEVRRTLLSFVRAQILWNEYKMDPSWMLQIMQRYGPLDWRLAQSHGLYWESLGLHVCQNQSLDQMESLMSGRILLNCLKALAWNGRLAYLENPQNPDEPAMAFTSDWRFIEPTQQVYMASIEARMKATGEPFNDNILRGGHINFLVSAVQMLYAGYNRRQAQEYYDWLRENYALTGEFWDLPLEEFVLAQLNWQGRPIPNMAISQITASLQAAYLLRVANDSAGSETSFRYARRVYDVYQKEALERNRLPQLSVLHRDVLRVLLIQPSVAGANIPLVDRARLYASVDRQLQLMLYDLVALPLAQQCKDEGLDFDAAFPAPQGIEQYRRNLQERMAQD